MPKGLKGFQKGNRIWLGRKQTLEHIQKRIKWHQGKPLSLRHRLSLSLNHADFREEKHPEWKGDKASYAAKHMWIRNKYGKAIICQNPNCTYKNPKRYEWANISKEYKRNKNDYIQLCPSCHRKWDMGKLIIKIDVLENTAITNG